MDYQTHEVAGASLSFQLPREAGQGLKASKLPLQLIGGGGDVWVALAAHQIVQRVTRHHSSWRTSRSRRTGLAATGRSWAAVAGWGEQHPIQPRRVQGRPIDRVVVGRQVPHTMMLCQGQGQSHYELGNGARV